MTVSKLTNPPSQNGVINKINEIIDNFPAGTTVDQTYDPTSANAQSGTAVAQAIATKTVVTFRDWSVS